VILKAPWDAAWDQIETRDIPDPTR
jgi:hypothetical protein